jgi:hypothetical protein
MGEADELLFVAEGDDACRSSSLTAPVAFRRDAVRLRSSSKKTRRSALLPRLGMS